MQTQLEETIAEPDEAQSNANAMPQDLSSEDGNAVPCAVDIMTAIGVGAEGLEKTAEHLYGWSPDEKKKEKKFLTSVPLKLQITPLIDVIFQLLIYFMVTASFLIGEGALTANMPFGDDVAVSDIAPPEQPLVLRLTPVDYSNVRIDIEGFNKPASDFSQLAFYLQSIQYNDKNQGGIYTSKNPVIIKSEGLVRWQHVVNAFNAAVSAGYENVSFGNPDAFDELIEG